MDMSIEADLLTLLPEIILALFAMAALLGSVFTGRDRVAVPLTWLTGMVMAVIAVWIIVYGAGGRTAFGGAFIEDGFSRFAKVGILLSAGVVLVMSQDYMQKRGLLRFEFPILVTFSAIGMMMMVSAGDLIVLYMGLELQSLSLYIIASLRRDSVKSTEAGLKYFVLGALSSGMLLYGASLVYGYSGTTLFSGIIQTAIHGEVSVALLFGMIFLISGLAFKVSAVPFHMWTPDVYEGSPTPVTTYFATAPKLAAICLFARMLFDAFGNAVADWQLVIAYLSLFSMFLGSIGGIGQWDFKRLMAYSSIAHMGFALMGLAGGDEFAVQSMLIYMAIYLVMSVGTFAFILMMERDGAPMTDIRALNMYAKREPGKALALLMLLFSLAGVPPFLGFFGKLYVLRAAYEGGLVWLAIAGVIASVIAAFYYLRIVFFMYFGEEGETVDTPASPALWSALMISAAVMLLGIVNMFGVETAAAAAAAFLVN